MGTYQPLDGEFDVLGDGRQEAPFVPRDGVSRHTEFRCEFELSETEEEPLFPKLPTRQTGVRLLELCLSIGREVEPRQLPSGRALKQTRPLLDLVPQPLSVRCGLLDVIDDEDVNGTS
jgi:hypothetical protein